MFLEQLNERQREAVLATEGAVLILAGAGSGKTRVLTTKIAHLIDEGVSPWEVVAITFTNKAANEMKVRVADLIAEDVDRMWIGTFHSICSRILRRDIDKLGYDRNFTIYDRDDQRSLMKEIYKDKGMTEERLKIASVLSLISDAKNRGLSPEVFEKEGGGFATHKAVAELYRAYEERKRKYNSLDFDDLIEVTLRLFAKEPKVAEYYARRFRYVFVDEYQDTNRGQYELVRYFAKEHGNISVVGDADQSIYGWRGADISNILDFEKDFPEAKTILLEENYRSTKPILDAANVLIRNNEERVEKNLWTRKEEGRKAEYHQFHDEYGESRAVVSLINNCVYDGYRLSDMAILYRTNAQSREFEEALMRESIPYRMVGGLKFYDRKEIKDVIAYLRVLVNPEDNVSLKRILNTPKRGIGDVTVAKAEAEATERGLSLYALLSEGRSDRFATKKAAASLDWFVSMMEGIRENLAEEKVEDVAKKVVERSGYLDTLKASGAVEDRTRLENIDSFISSVAEYEAQEEGATLEEFLQSVSLLSDVDKTDESSSGVNLMTIHSSKGLEYPIVFLTGMEEGLFPSRRSLDEGGLEEERRLCYVAVTRAKERLYMTGTSLRRFYGKIQQTVRSRFVEEMEECIEIVETTKKKEEWTGAPSSSEMRESIRKAVLEKKKAIKAKDAEELQLGDKVRHKTWGVGTVVSIAKKEGGDELVIAFDSKGLKKLNAAIAPIVRL